MAKTLCSTCPTADKLETTRYHLSTLGSHHEPVLRCGVWLRACWHRNFGAVTANVLPLGASCTFFFT
ncbi:MAG: hypothetical protein KDA58_07575, partial [Planctomycetaceae bacterium]|nr:hypothetical protein [Planctomycetaceae bacterium]